MSFSMVSHVFPRTMVSFCRVMVLTLQAWRYSQDLHEGEGVHLLGIGSDLLGSNYDGIVTNQTPYTVYDEDITLNLKAFILTITYWP